jgi:hypothetical protein
MSFLIDVEKDTIWAVLYPMGGIHFMFTVNELYESIDSLTK